MKMILIIGDVCGVYLWVGGGGEVQRVLDTSYPSGAGLGAMLLAGL